MVSWKKPLAILATTTCLVFGSHQSVLSQNTKAANDIFSKPWPTENRRQTKPQVAAAQSPVVQQTSTQKTSQSPAAPTIIVRPSVDGSALNDCEMEINKIADSQNDFSIRLSIPDSITSIELIPSSTHGAQRNFRIQMEQTTPGSKENPTPQPPKNPTAIQLPQTNQPPERFASNRSMTEQVRMLKSTTENNAKADTFEPREGFVKNPHFSIPKFSAFQHRIQRYQRQSYVEQDANVPMVQRIETTDGTETTDGIEVAKSATTETAISNAPTSKHPFVESELIGASDLGSRPNESRTKSPNPISKNQAIAQAIPNEQTETTPKHSHAQTNFVAPIVSPNLTANVTADVTPEPDSTTAIQTELAPVYPTSKFMSELVGSENIAFGQQGDFAVFLANPTSSRCTDIVLTLELPDGFEVGLLDREATIDRHSRTITWRLDSLAAGAEAIIRYRVRSEKLGQQKQRLNVTANHAQKPVDTHSELMTNVTRN